VVALMDGPMPFEKPLNKLPPLDIQLLNCTFKLTGSINRYASNCSGVVGVTVGVMVGVGVFVLVGVFVGVMVLVGVTDGVFVLVGVIDMVGVIDGVIDMLGVMVGVGVGVVHCISMVTPIKNCALVILSYIGVLSVESR
jgi:hypothetical protein